MLSYAEFSSRKSATLDQGPTSHAATLFIEQMCDAGPGSHIARGKFPHSKNVRRGTGVPRRMSNLFGNRVSFLRSLCVFCRMPKPCRENPRRGTGVPHRTRLLSIFKKCATRDRGPTSHAEHFRRRGFRIYVCASFHMPRFR